MLSVVRVPLPETWEEMSARIPGAVRGRPVTPMVFAGKPSREVLAQLGADFPVKELEYLSVAGEPMYLATGPHAQTRIVPLRGEPVRALDRNLLLAARGEKLSFGSTVDLRATTIGMI